MGIVLILIIFALVAFGIKVDMTKPQRKRTVLDAHRAFHARIDGKPW